MMNYWIVMQHYSVETLFDLWQTHYCLDSYYWSDYYYDHSVVDAAAYMAVIHGEVLDLLALMDYNQLSQSYCIFVLTVDAVVNDSCYWRLTS